MRRVLRAGLCGALLLIDSTGWAQEAHFSPEARICDAPAPPGWAEAGLNLALLLAVGIGAGCAIAAALLLRRWPAAAKKAAEGALWSGCASLGCGVVLAVLPTPAMVIPVFDGLPLLAVALAPVVIGAALLVQGTEAGPGRRVRVARLQAVEGEGDGGSEDAGKR